MYRRDMGVPTLEFMLNTVQMMAEKLKEPGAKIAVHCHAGLGISYIYFLIG
jgi:protein-tyrosine phosphatase